MIIRRTEGVRYTHLPTGLTALSRDCAPRGQKWRWYHQAARKLLLARLCRPEANGIAGSCRSSRIGTFT